MGLFLYTTGVISITIGCLNLLNLTFHMNDWIVCVIISIASIASGIIGVLDGIIAMRKK